MDTRQNRAIVLAFSVRRLVTVLRDAAEQLEGVADELDVAARAAGAQGETGR